METEGKKEEQVTSPAELNTKIEPTEEEAKEAGISVPEPEPTTEPGPEEGVTAAPAPEPAPEPDPVREENGVTASHALSQEQVNDLMGKTRSETRERTFRYIYDRYGVADEAGLDELVGNAQRYDSLSERYDADKESWKGRERELEDLREQVALLQSGIDPSRYDDAKAILRAKGVEVTADSIKDALPTHPEWGKREDAPVAKISAMGNEPTAESEPGESEEDMVMKRYFKV